MASKSRLLFCTAQSTSLDEERTRMSIFAPRKGMTEVEIIKTIAAVLAEATLEEKVGMMSGAGFFAAYMEDDRVWAARPYRAGGGIERLGIEPFYFTDGPRGVARGQSTCFPCTMARGATFDPELEQRIGEVMGIEARAQGCTLSGAVCFNLLRYPSWGARTGNLRGRYISPWRNGRGAGRCRKYRR
jgi:beta-glucosidase